MSVTNYLKTIKKIRNSKHFTIAVAESCTGGLISSKLTSIDGSSSFFQGSIISYSNDMKSKILNVKENTIKKYGAVSHHTALEMVKGLKKISKSEILISVTGVAGPKGGTNNTPIGCVYFGVGIKKNKKYYFQTIKKIFKEKTRNKIQIKSAEFALKEIIKHIKKI